MTKTQTPINWQLCLELSNQKPALAKELLVMFAKELPLIRDGIKSSYANKNYPELENHLHKLHGACCYCGVPLLKEITKKFESEVKQMKINEFSNSMLAIEKEIDRVIQALNDNDYE